MTGRNPGFVAGLDEQGPDVPGFGVADRERDDAGIDFDNPAASAALDGFRDVGVADHARDEPVFPDGAAHALHGRDIGARCRT